MRRIKDSFLLVTDCGSWIALDKDEYRSLIRYELKDDLFKLLEEKCIILTENNTKQLMKYYQDRHDFLFNGASLHIIVPTLRCNQKCVYCHSSAAHSSDMKKDMDAETAKNTLEFIFQTPSKSITIEFQGGDSLLNFDLLKYIMTTARHMNKEYKKKIQFALVTNLTLLTDESFEWLVKENIDICTSLDGPKHIHDANRKYESGTGTYDTVTKWMKEFKKRKKPVSALMVTTKQSLPFTKDIVDEYVKWGMNSIQIKYMHSLGFANDAWKKIGYSTEEFIQFWKKCLDYIIELNKKGTYITERLANIILRKILTTKDPLFLDFRSPCGMVIGQLAYDYNGDIYSCDEGRNFELFKLGNVKNSRYGDVVTQNQSRALVSSSINENLTCAACAYKPFCGTCPVLNYAEGNNIIPKLSKNSKCKMAKAQFDYIFEKLLFDNDTRKVFFSWVRNWQKKQNN